MQVHFPALCLSVQLSLAHISWQINLAQIIVKSWRRTLSAYVDCCKMELNERFYVAWIGYDSHCYIKMHFDH